MTQHDGIPVDGYVFEMAEFFKVFGDPTRLRILFVLQQKGEMAVQAVADTLHMKQSAISQQLKLLRTSRLVKYRKAGRSMFYSLNDDHILKILSMGLDHISEGLVFPEPEP